jgi:predicted anti-sigma-YlaC factor YlaD
MNVIGAGGPACREMRQLLGVYVVGAIEPAERALVDEHLGECAACRDELAGLAGLPAMLSRVPEADVARLGGGVVSLPQPDDPSPELLNSLLRRVAGRRRTRLYRGVAAVAAAAVIAAGGTAAVLSSTGSASATAEVAAGANTAAHISAVVDYSPTSWGTAMRVQVTGIAPGTACKFWVLEGNGRAPAGSWTVSGAGYGASQWFAASSAVRPASVHGFLITAAATGKALVRIPAR